MSDSIENVLVCNLHRIVGGSPTAFGPLHQPRQITGPDIAVVNAGRISAVCTFLDLTGA